MKKILGILVVLAFVGSICFAQEAAKTSPAPTKPFSVASATKTIVGKVCKINRTVKFNEISTITIFKGKTSQIVI